MKNGLSWRINQEKGHDFFVVKLKVKKNKQHRICSIISAGVGGGG